MNPLVTRVETLESNENASKALRMFEDNDLLVITRAGKYFGILTPEMVLRFSADADRTKAGRLATNSGVIKEKELKYLDLARKLAGSRFGCVIVLDGAGRPIGMVNAASLLKFSPETARRFKAGELVEVLPSLEADTRVDKAIEVLIKKGATEAGVLDDGKFIGILTARDIAAKIKPYLHKKNHDLEQREWADPSKDRIRGVMTPEFSIRRVPASLDLSQALEEVEYGNAYVFEGPLLKGRLEPFKALAGIEEEAPSHIEISGLGPDEAIFRESIFEECASVLRKFGKGGTLHLRVRSARKGKGKKIYEVHGRLEIGRMAFVCATPEMAKHGQNWDLWMAISEVLEELKKSYLKKK